MTLRHALPMMRRRHERRFMAAAAAMPLRLSLRRHTPRCHDSLFALHTTLPPYHADDDTPPPLLCGERQRTQLPMPRHA